MAPDSIPHPRRALTEARQLRGWSQHELADLVGTTQVNISRWERGITNPGPYFRRKLSILFEKEETALDLWTGDRATDSPTGHAIFDPMLPLPPATELIGRTALLEKIKQRIFDGESVALSALNGLPGIGKTTLAVSLAYDEEIREHFSGGIFWAGVGPTSHLLELLSRWGALLGIPSTEIARLGSLEAWVLALRQAIGLRRMLIIIDDVWQIEDALTLKVGGPHCAYLVTTRSASLALEFTHAGAITVTELSEEEGMLLLKQLAPAVTSIEPQGALRLVRAVGGLPLALALMGNYLRTQTYGGQTRRIQAALRKLSQVEERLRLAAPTGATGHHHPGLSVRAPLSLQSVIDITVQKLDVRVQAVLYALSVFPAKPNSFSEVAALAVAECTVDDLDILSDSGLLEGNGEDRYSLHQTIADYAGTHLNDQAPYERLVAYALTFTLSHAIDYPALAKENAPILAAFDAALQLGRHDALIEGICVYAPYLLQGGRHAQAGYYLQHARESLAGLGEKQSWRVLILQYLGQVRLLEGNYPEAEACLQEALALAEQEERKETSFILATLGNLRLKQGMLAQAKAFLERGLLLARQGEDKTTLCNILRTLGAVEGMEGNFSRSMDHLQEGLSLARQLESGDLEVAFLTNLGVATHQLGNLGEAMRFYQEALIPARRIAYHRAVAALLSNLGVVANQQGDYHQARSYLREGLELARESGDLERVGFLLIDLGEVAIEQGKWTEGDDVLQEALDLGHQLGHGEILAAAAINLGAVKQALGNDLQATHLLQEGLNRARQINIVYLICRALTLSGEVALQQQQFEAARTFFEEVQAVVPQGSLDLLAASQFGLARLAAAQGNDGEARLLAERSLENYTRADHKGRLQVEAWLSKHVIAPSPAQRPGVAEQDE